MCFCHPPSPGVCLVFNFHFRAGGSRVCSWREPRKLQVQTRRGPSLDVPASNTLTLLVRPAAVFFAFMVGHDMPPNPFPLSPLFAAFLQSRDNFVQTSPTAGPSALSVRAFHPWGLCLDEPVTKCVSLSLPTGYTV